jgi:hypothetical protein
MPLDKSKYTHDAYLFKSEGVRKGRRLGYWEKEGYARSEGNNRFFISLHSAPIGGFDGRIWLRPFGDEPPAEPKEQPQRPAREPQPDDEADEI